MKKISLIIIALLISFMMISCKSKPIKVSDLNEFENLFEGSIKYDIRTESECEDGHIKGFVCMGDKTAEELANNIDIVSKDNSQKIILIGDEQEVLKVFDILGKKGHKNMYYFDGGYQQYASLKGEDYSPETGCGC